MSYSIAIAVELRYEHIRVHIVVVRGVEHIRVHIVVERGVV